MPDLRTLITDEELARLRAAYDSAAMNEGARRATEAPFPPASMFVDSIIATFYGPRAVLPAMRREQVLIAVLAAHAGMRRILAVHLYWALMEGLSIDEICATLLLVGTYDGIDNYSEATRHFGTLLDKVLRPALDAGEPDALSSTAIMKALSQAFP
jgi:alkylhydroperoxidase/carboxymuconolactone decarboxylase family protein YurZ